MATLFPVSVEKERYAACDVYVNKSDEIMRRIDKIGYCDDGGTARARETRTRWTKTNAGN